MSLRRAAGQAAFADDVALPGLLHVAVRRSPMAHARVDSVDAAAASALPGVALVLTPADAPSLLRGEALFEGAPLAVAAAEDPELARRAANAVAIGLEPLLPVLDSEAAAADETCVAARLAASEGDVEEALARADHVVAREWRLPFAPFVALEPPLALTWLDEDRRLVVRTSAGVPFRVRGLLAERLSLPAARIRVARPHVAGGSPGRVDLLVEGLCAIVTLLTGRPARLALGADETLAIGPGRPAQRTRLRLGVEGGRLNAIDVDFLADVGGADEAAAAELLSSAARQALGLYRCAATRVSAVAVRTHHPPSGTGRGADAGIALALECAVDEAASLVGEEPGPFRRRHLRGAGDPGAGTLAGLGEAPGADESRGVARLLTGPRPAARARRSTATPDAASRHAVGIGIARRSAGAAASSGAAASLRLLDDGSFALATGAASSGGADDPEAARAAAAILTVPEANVVSGAGDTDSAAFDAGDSAPTASMTRRAVEETARAAVARIREAGARLLGAAVDGTRVEGGRVRDAAGRSVGFDEIGRDALRRGEPFVVTTAPGAAAFPPSLAAAEAEVEVDLDTGVVRVARLVAAVEGGPFADGAGVLAEVEGALAGAIEQALAAGLPSAPAAPTGLARFRTHPLIAPLDVPPLAVTFVPPADGTARSGGAALADAAGRAALAAITNAVARAAGGRPTTLPLAPPRVLDLLETRAR